jgi:hypothetical protein
MVPTGFISANACRENVLFLAASPAEYFRILFRRKKLPTGMIVLAVKIMVFSI